jgi:hypothetical protein
VMHYRMPMANASLYDVLGIGAMHYHVPMANASLYDVVGGDALSFAYGQC